MTDHDRTHEPRVSDYAPKPRHDPQTVHQLRQVADAVSTPLRVEEREEAKQQIARNLRWLPLRTAMEMAQEIVELPDYKAPATKIELAMILNEWAYTKGED